MPHDNGPVTRIIVAAELWGTSILPQGLTEQWSYPEGAFVEAGDQVATVRIEDSLHQLVAPTRGLLSIDLVANSVIEPGISIGTISVNTASNP